jgi:hypothetical protein
MAINYEIISITSMKTDRDKDSRMKGTGCVRGFWIQIIGYWFQDRWFGNEN